jgi:hypothetical protein
MPFLFALLAIPLIYFYATLAPIRNHAMSPTRDRGKPNYVTATDAAA